MALKFLNKKGWHTGSLRNIENVWKAEQKRDAEQKKLEELQKQIQEEREKAEFRRLQEQAGLIPSQERLDFLYDSGLAVGKGSSSGGFKALESCPRPTEETAPSSSSQQPAAPGALFEEKQQSANDAWRKLHSDPLLMIRQREQEALARIKNNPVKMATIRKSVESKKHKDKADDGDHLDDQSLHRKHSSTKHKSNSKKNKKSRRTGEISSSDDEKTIRSRKHSHKDLRDDRRTGRRYDEDGRASKRRFESKDIKDDRHSGKRDDEDGRANRRSSQSKYKQGRHIESRADKYVDGEKDLKKDRHAEGRHTEDGSGTRRNHDKDRAESPNGKNVQKEGSDGPRQRRRNAAPKLSEEERAARLREMQMNAELHEEQRWKRLKKAEEEDAKEASRDTVSRGRSFLDAAQKSVYGAEKGGSSTIEESVRRRTYFSQGKSAAEGNAFVR